MRLWAGVVVSDRAAARGARTVGPTHGGRCSISTSASRFFFQLKHINQVGG